MESAYLPWQTPSFKMDRKRTPLADSALEESAAKQQRTPPVVKPSSESFIWRTRSLDDGRSRSSARSGNSDSSHGEERHDERLPNKESHEEEDLQQPLHSSFDASLLENDDFHSIFRVSKRRASASGISSLWNNASNDLTPHSSGRKHLRQPKTRTLRNDGEEDESLVCPGTVRKLARHNSNESIKSRGTPVRPPTHWRTNTTLTKLTAPNTVWKPPLIKFPLTPTAPNSTATTHPPTTQERPLETTLEMDSMATNSSPSTTPFRFTSFPASLPRVHPPLRDMNQGSAPDSIRKRMFPPSIHQHPTVPPAATGTNSMNQSREEDGTQNTSISSLSTHGEEDPRMPPVHTRLFMEEEYAYSDDDEDDDDDDCTGVVGRTRLNFNLMLSPKMPMEKDESPFKDLEREEAQKNVLKMPLEDVEDVTAKTDLSRPYEQRHVHSFPSTMSSHTPLRSLSGCDDLATASTSGLTASGGDAPLDTAATHQNHAMGPPATPEEVQLHIQFDAAQCSPIPGIPEEEELHTRPTLPSGKTSGRLPPKPHPTTSTTAPTSAEANPLVFKPSNSVAKEGQQDDVRLSFSQESVSSSTSAKLRRFRPMPDMAAFALDSGSKNGQDGSADNMSGAFRSPSPKLLCPPTPVRTPVWAHTSDDGPGTGERPLAHHHRSNSLIATRVLATCSPQSMGPNYAMTKEGSSSAPAKSSADASMDMDLEPTGSKPVNNVHDHPGCPQHPEAPPPIRRAVGEMGSIISFATDFETLGILGKGAFADVYKVRCKQDNKQYAVKRNRRHFRGKRDRDMALVEVRSMQRLQQHSASDKQQQEDFLQHLLFFYRAWQEDGHFFCQTELCCRDTCRELMDSLSHEWCIARDRYPSLLRNLPAPEGVVAGSSSDVIGRLVPDVTVWKICHDVCAGLSHIHARGLCHNDIKPSNIFFVANGERTVIKIGDFGLAGAIGNSDDGMEGDSSYMAPELLSSGVKHASADIFSLGLLLYEVAAGHGFDLPKQGPRWHEVRNGRHVPELPSVREVALGQLIKHMIANSQEQRPSAAAMLKHERVHFAGKFCDEFLRDYIKDINEYDRQEDERQAAVDRMADDKTPRTGSNGNVIPCRARVCSPTYFTTAPNMMFTPEAQ